MRLCHSTTQHNAVLQVYRAELAEERRPHERTLGPAATNESVAKLPEGKKVAGRWFLLQCSLCVLPVAAGWLDGEQVQGKPVRHIAARPVRTASCSTAC